MQRQSIQHICAVLAVCFVACSSCTANNPTTWDDVTPSPDAELYVGDLTAPLTIRLGGRLTERALTLTESRVELLPAGVTWAEHIEFRTQNAGELPLVVERIPEPDRPVLMAEYHADNKTLFVIANADESGDQLIVLTALTAN